VKVDEALRLTNLYEGNQRGKGPGAPCQSFFKERPNMSKPVEWEQEWDRALARARTEGKPVFADFFNPN
jgi:hypothetical protein